MLTTAPMPPLELRERSGSTPAGEDPDEFFDRTGAAHKKHLLELMPAPRRALDFGCGVGRVLRHFTDVELWGCDIDAPSVQWVGDNLPVNAFTVTAEPGLPLPDGQVDTAWGLSVFSHLTDEQWAGWMLELHRVLTDDGRVVLTFQADGLEDLWRDRTGTRWNPNRVGMSVLHKDAPWNVGGPLVFHSEWWIRAHWGRAFTVERLETNGFGGLKQGYALLRKRPGEFTHADLERREPGRREWTASMWDAARQSLPWRAARKFA